MVTPVPLLHNQKSFGLTLTILPIEEFAPNLGRPELTEEMVYSLWWLC